MPIWERPSSTPTYLTGGGGSCITGRTHTPAGAPEATAMTPDLHLSISLAVVAAVGWLMTRAGVAKNALEDRQRRRSCPSCGRVECGCLD